MPSLMASASIALGGTEKCCQVPTRSVKRKSIILTSLSLMDLRTPSALVQFRNIGRSPFCPLSLTLIIQQWNHGESLRSASYCVSARLGCRAAVADNYTRLPLVKLSCGLRVRGDRSQPRTLSWEESKKYRALFALRS